MNIDEFEGGSRQISNVGSALSLEGIGSENALVIVR